MCVQEIQGHNHRLQSQPSDCTEPAKSNLQDHCTVTDITYIPCREGRLYLASVMDLYTRKIVGWNLASRMTTDLVLAALDEAYAVRSPLRGNSPL
ncbi:MAG: DDE-type integrase/transposase/recombinase [Bacillota bacterium]